MEVPESVKGYLALLPALVLILTFVVAPVLWGIYISFTNYSLTGYAALKYSFIKFANYIKLLTDPDFLNSLKVSVLFTIFSALVGQALLGFTLAVLFRTETGRKIRLLPELCVFLAWIIPEVVAGYMWGVVTDKYGLFGKIFNFFGKFFHYTYGGWYKSPLLSIIVGNIWRGTAFSMILFMAALEGIPQYIYEAADVDGASGWQKLRYVILPLVAYAFLIDFILITIWTFNVFTMIFVWTGGGPGTATELWTIFVYKRAMQPPYKFGYACAAANIMFLIVLALIITYLKLVERFRV